VSALSHFPTLPLSHFSFFLRSGHCGEETSSRELRIICIDGSNGEEGGQILRTSLALSAILRQPLQVDRIRAGRKKPGLMPRHLTGVQAVARICGDMVEGVGSLS